MSKFTVCAAAASIFMLEGCKSESFTEAQSDEIVAIYLDATEQLNNLSEVSTHTKDQCEIISSRTLKKIKKIACKKHKKKSLTTDEFHKFMSDKDQKVHEGEAFPFAIALDNCITSAKTSEGAE